MLQQRAGHVFGLASGNGTNHVSEENNSTNSGVSKQTRTLEPEKLNAIVARSCQYLERANGRLTKRLIKQNGSESICKHDREELGL